MGCIMHKTALALMALALGGILGGTASAATCRSSENYERWLEDFKKEAVTQGISDRVVGGSRIPNGLAKIKQHAALFARVEQKYGVPAPVLTAFWGLESDFGANFGKYNILSAIASLAYDCRRPEFFRQQLFDALRIVQRGDQRMEDMVGDWAGEFGGMQFTATDYLKNAVDFDGDGHRDLIKSVPDTLASAANFLVSLSWQRGQPWLQE